MFSLLQNQQPSASDATGSSQPEPACDAPFDSDEMDADSEEPEPPEVDFQADINECDSPLGKRRCLAASTQRSDQSTTTDSSSQASSIAPYDPVGDLKDIVFRSAIFGLLVGLRCVKGDCIGLTNSDSIQFSNVGTALKVAICLFAFY